MKQLILTFTLVVLSLATGSCSGFTFRNATENMLPTVQVGDTLFCDPTYYKHSPVERGHIVVINSPDKKLSDAAGKEAKFVFRIVGIGGDKVQIKDGRVFVNDSPFTGTLGSGQHSSKESVEDYGAITIPPDEYFLLGDNLPFSTDSRFWERPTIKKDLIYGRVTLLRDGKTGQQRDL